MEVVIRFTINICRFGLFTEMAEFLYQF